MRTVSKTLSSAALFVQLLTILPTESSSQWYIADLRDTNNQADYIIVSPPSYASFVEPLAAFRSTHNNFTVAIVLTDSIYRSFGQGVRQDSAIKSFFSYALRLWRNPKPEYFLLVGNENTMPSHKEPGLYLPPTFTEDSVRVDQWFVQGIADTAFANRVDASIGRFPAWNAQQLQTMVAKTISYEMSTDTSWYRRSIQVADSGETDIFEWHSSLWMQSLSTRWSDTIGVHVRVNSPFHRSRTEFINLFNQGASILSFSGHMNFYQFSRAAYFRTWDVDSLSNGDRLPFCILLADQRFEKQDTLCIALNLLQSSGKGVVATLAPTGATFLSSATSLVRRVFEEMVSSPLQPIGKTIRIVKNAFGTSQETAKQTLLGDPALVIKHRTVSSVVPPGVLPQTFVLHQNYPNPFNPSTTIKFEIPEAGFVLLRVYNILGQEVAVLVREEMNAGSYSVTWDAFDAPSGVYLYRLQFRPTSDGHVRNFTVTKKMVLMR